MRQAQDRLARMSGEVEKEGFDTGRTAINPFTGEAVPIWVANFVLGEYGTGARSTYCTLPCRSSSPVSPPDASMFALLPESPAETVNVILNGESVPVPRVCRLSVITSLLSLHPLHRGAVGFAYIWFPWGGSAYAYAGMVP